MVHVNTPWLLTDSDDFQDLVFSWIDHTDNTQIRIGRVKESPIVGWSCDVDALDLTKIFVRIQLRYAWNISHLNLLQQFMTSHVNDAHPMCAVVAHISLRAVRQKGHVQRFDQTGNSLDFRQRQHVDDGYRITLGIALVIPTSIGRKGQM